MSPSSAGAADTKTRRQPGVTHRANTFVPLCGVKFVYDDKPEEPLRKRCVLYWMYDRQGGNLDNVPEDPYYWHRRRLFMPAYCSQTGEDGTLEPTDLIDGLSVVVSPESNQSIRYAASGVHEVRFRNEGFGVTLYGADKFPAGRKVGFLLLPPDELQRFETLNLVDIPSTHGAWVGRVTRDGQVVRIHCTLPEWGHRIAVKTRLLRECQERYEAYAKKHMEAIGRIEVMITFVQLNARFSCKGYDRGRLNQALDLVGKLDNMKQRITDRYLTNTDQSTECGRLLAAVRTAADDLFALIKSTAFVDEIERYMPYAIPDEGQKLRGPFTSSEFDWRRVFDILGDAYAALAKTEIGETVYREHVEPLVSYLANLCADGHPQWPATEGGLIGQLRDALPQEDLRFADNPLLTAVAAYADLLQNAVSPAPGLPCLVEAVLNSYGLHLSKRMSEVNTILAGKYFRSLLGFMKLLRLGREVTTSQQYMLAQAANFGDLSKGKAMLFDLTREFMKDRYGAAAGRILGTNLFLLSIVSFAAAVRSDPSETLRYWSGIVAAGSSLALSSIGLLFAKYEAALAFRLCTGALGVVGGIASFILSVSEVAEAREDRESARMWLSIAAAAGSAMLTVGFLITAIGAGTSWTGVGLVLVLAGVVISIVASVTMLIMALLTQRSEETFKGLRREFAAEGGAYDTEYRPISDLAQAYRDVVDAGNRMSWCAFSWRAIVPLYCMGFSVRNDLGAEDLVATAKGLEALIDNESDSGSHKTIARFLLSYRQAVKNPSLDADRSGVADVFEWQKGTIYPERSPAPIPVG